MISPKHIFLALSGAITRIQSRALRSLVLFLIAIVAALGTYTIVRAAPTIIATMTAAIIGDDGDNKADPGEIIEYTVTIPNSGTDATGVTYNNTIDPNTTLVGGSLAASPVASNDTFPVTVVGNVSINSANPASPFSVTANDFLGLNSPATIVETNITTTQGGQVVMTTSGADMGKFTYNPPAGFEGADTFTYTLTDNANATSAASNRQATVSITVSGMVWFVDNNASACIVAGCGRLSNPFSTLAAFNTLNNGTGNNPAANDNIFVYESGSGYSGAVTLLSGQKLIGQDATASLSTITGLTPPTGSASLPAMNSGNGTVTNITSTVTLNTNTTARGLSINSTTSTGMDDPVAAITGVSVSETKVITTTGTGVNFSNTAGSFNFIELTTSGGTGASLTGSNSGATFTFSDVTVSSGANPAFTATGGGTVNVTGINTITTTTGTAVNITNTTIGTSNVTFQSVAHNGNNTAITLTNTGSGQFMVTGTGATAGSGGTIQNIVGADAVTLNATGGLVTLKNMIIQDITAAGDAAAVNDTRSGVDAIHGQMVNGGMALNNVTIQRISDDGINGSVDGLNPTATVFNGLTITNCTIQDTNRFNVANHADAQDEAAVYIFGIKGTVSVTGSTFQRAGSGLFLTTDTAGSLDMTVTGNSFLTLYKEIGTLSQGLFGINVTQEGSLTSVVRIGDKDDTDPALGNTFTNGGDRASIRVISEIGSTGSMKAEIARNTFTITDHSSPGQPAGNTFYNFPQGGVLLRARGSGNYEGFFASNMLDQVMHADGGLGQLSLIAENGDSEFIVQNNTFKLPWDAPIELRADGNSGTQTSCKVLFQNNTYVDGIVGDGTTDLGGPSPYNAFYVQVRNNGRMDLTIQNENPFGLHDPSSGFANSFHAQTTSAGDVLNLFLQNTKSPNGYQLKAATGTTYNLYRNGSGAGTAQLVLQDNGNTGGAGSDVTTPPVTNLSGAGTVTLSNTAPTLPAIVISMVPDNNHTLAQAQPESDLMAFSQTTGTKLHSMNAPVKVQGDSELAKQIPTNASHTEALNASTAIGGGKPLFSVQPSTVQPAPLQSGETVTVPAFTLPAGKSVTIKYRVTVNNPLPQNATQISNQGTVSGSNFSNVLTDDPSVGGASDPTITNVDLVDLTASKSNDTSGTITLGNSFNWVVTVSNIATSRDAIFTSGQTVLADHLPGAATYGTASPSYDSGIVGTMSCSISSNVLTCTADAGGLTIPSGKFVKATWQATPTSGGSLVNPTGGVCQADPNTVFAEVSTANNSCSDTVTVTRPNTTVTSIDRQTPSGANTNASSVKWRVTFADAVSGLTSSNFTLTDVTSSITGESISTVAAVTGTPDTQWDVTVNTGTGSGTLRLDLANDISLSHNVTNAPYISGQTYTIDKTGPLVSSIVRQSPVTNPTNADALVFRVTFNEAVTSVGASSFVVTGTTTTITNVASVTPNLVFDFTLNGTVNGDLTNLNGTVGLDIASSPIVTDLAGNTLQVVEPTPASTNDQTYTVDNAVPTVSMSSAATDPTNTSPIPVTVQFSETVTGFIAGDITPGNGTVDNFIAVDGDTYTFNLTPSGQGSITADIAAGVATDGISGNTAATQFSRTYDSVAPTVTINQAAGQADPTGTSPINFTVVFSEAVTGFATGDVTLSGTAGATTGTITEIAPMNGTTYNVAVSGMGGNGTVIASIAINKAQDTAGNNNAASTSTDNTVTYDSSAPTVTINQAVGQADPAGTSPVNFTVVFSELVTGFATGDVTLSGTAGATTGTVTEITPMNGTTYNVAVSGMTGDGTVIATIASGVALDASSNGNNASTSTDNSVTYDATTPTVTINQAVGQSDPTNSSPINFTVVFSELVTGFATGDVTLSGTAGATTGTVTETAPMNGTTYNVAVSGMSGPGTVIATINASVAVDAASKPNNSSTSTDNSVAYDSIAPTVAINQASGQADPTNVSPVNFTVVFSEPMTGFVTGDVTLSGTAGATTATVTEIAPNDGTTYNVAVSGMTTGGTIIASVNAGVAQDLAGNVNAASASTDNTVTFTFDTTTTITSDAPDPSIVGETVTFNYTVTVNAPGSGTPTGNVTVSDGTNSCTGTVAAGSCTITFATPGARTLTATYAGDTFFNGSTSSGISHQVNNANTTTTITSDAPDPSIAGQSVTVNFSVTVVAPASGTPTGNVTVSDGVDSCTGTVASGACSVTLTTPGIRTLTATYAGDANFGGSASLGASHTVNQAPAITSANAAGFAINTAESFTVTTSGYPTGASMLITQTGSLPSGVTFIDNGDGTATLSGTATASGDFPITITASNGIAPDATQNFTLTVGQAPAITSANAATFSVGSAGNFTVTTTGFPNPTLTRTGALPTGVTFTDNGDGTASLSGTPGAGTSGIYPITITASNGVGANATQNFTLTVNEAPAITSLDHATFITGTAGSFTITSTGFPASGLSETGSLPNGVTFADNGNGTASLSGTATISGVFPITITASNGVAPDATQNFTLTVNPAGPIFIDVPLDYWAAPYIASLYYAGITGGCGTSPLAYCPENSVTRAEMAVFLKRGIHGSSYVPPVVTTFFFMDSEGHWAQYWIEDLRSESFTAGCTPTTYCPDNPITRAQAAVFLLRLKHGAAYTPPPASGTLFTDVPADQWAAAWIEELANEGITSGCGGGDFCPEQVVTRAQIAVFLVRTLGLP